MWKSGKICKDKIIKILPGENPVCKLWKNRWWCGKRVLSVFLYREIHTLWKFALKIEELFLKEFDNGIYFSGKLVIVFHVFFDFFDRVKDSGMMFASEFISDVIERCFG